MAYETYTERLDYLLELALKQNLKSIKQISEKFNCSESTIKRMLKTLRNKGYNIKYCPVEKKFIEKN
ncbi:MAG: HTH domain-containing protein [Flavobacteriales bacterium]|nr:HTH domain-containing protein [Flavobacteriales bacterium]